MCRQIDRKIPIVSLSLKASEGRSFLRVANRSGGASPSLFSHVEKEIQSEVDYVGVHGQDNKTSQAPSMLVEFDENNRFRVIRS